MITDRFFTIFTICAAALLAACSGNNKGTEKVPADSVAEVVKIDTITCNHINFSDSTKHLQLKLYVETPETKNEILNASVYEWICNFAESTYLGKQDDMKALFEYMWQMHKKGLEDMSDGAPQSMWEIRITKASETKDVLTYFASMESYDGGAHGGYSYIFQMFDRNTGKRLGWNIFIDKLALYDFMEEGLVSYFNSFDETANKYTKENIEETLMLETPGFIPLPKSEPWFSNDSIFFTYQQYEVCCYADGMPTFGFPVSRLKKYISPQALKLLGR